jgi:hypothetical protein
MLNVVFLPNRTWPFGSTFPEFSTERGELQEQKNIAVPVNNTDTSRSFSMHNKVKDYI